MTTPIAAMVDTVIMAGRRRHALILGPAAAGFGWSRGHACRGATRRATFPAVLRRRRWAVVAARPVGVKIIGGRSLGRARRGDPRFVAARGPPQHARGRAGCRDPV